MNDSFFDSTGTPLLLILVLALLILEGRYELRRRVDSRWKRLIINLGVAVPAFVLLRILFIPVMIWLAHLNEKFEFGLNYLYKLPHWVEFIIAFLVLDYGNYLWHKLNHKVSFFWRFHVVHHTDPDLDISTAFRFHFGEIITSVFFRGAITFLSGATPETVIVAELFLEAATQFHHSNLKLPLKAEQLLNKLIVTPRMHGIHHSTKKNETDSNYSVIFSLWDRIHSTFRFNKPVSGLKIGIPSYQDRRELTIGFLLKLPFTSIRPWGKEPDEADSNS